MTVTLSLVRVFNPMHYFYANEAVSPDEESNLGMSTLQVAVFPLHHQGLASHARIELALHDRQSRVLPLHQ